MQLTRPQLLTLLAASIAILAGNAAVTLLPLAPEFKLAFTDITYPLWNLLAVAALFYAARRSWPHSHRQGLAWGVIALSQLFYVIGDVLWAYYEVWLQQSPYPSPADFFYTALYPLLLAGVLLLPARPLKRSEWLKLILDIAIIMLAAGLVAWNYLLGPAFASEGISRLELTLSIAYPAGDLAVLWGLLVLIYRRQDEALSVPLALLAIGMSITIFCDCIYSYQALAGEYISGSALDNFWLLAYGFFAWAGIWQGKLAAAPAHRPGAAPGQGVRPSCTASLASYLPYLWIAAAYLLLMRSHFETLSMNFASLALGVGSIILLIMIRQILTLDENSRLLGQLQLSSDRIRSQSVDLHRANQMLQVEIEEHRRAEEKLAHDALHDDLTGLPNRTLFTDRLRHAIELARAYPQRAYAVLFLDLDSFKVVNDSLGHVAGDQLLIRVARSLEACLRKSDTVARLGGDEFVVLLEDLQSVDEATLTAGRILQRLNTPVEMQGHSIVTSASIGILLNLREYDNPDEALQNADIAMYRAKLNGKAQCTVFQPSFRESAMLRLQMENDLRDALDKDQFELYYQPITHLTNDEIFGFEALLRWHHPALGLVQPADFIPLAEETGLIIPIGYWVIAEACRQAGDWQARFKRSVPLSMSVNISGAQLHDPAFVERVTAILTDAGLPLDSLRLEITEQVCLDRSNGTLAALRTLQQMGVQIHIDDFGVGYSSLSYIQDFPIRCIKIDQSFIAHLGDNASNRHIVQTIINLADELGLETVAEGVETQEQKDTVVELGCSSGQGFLFSRPATRAQVEALLAAGQ